MKRLVPLIALLWLVSSGGSVLAAPAGAGHSGKALEHPTRTATIQREQIASATQLQIPASIFPAGFTIKTSQAVTAQDADNPQINWFDYAYNTGAYCDSPVTTEYYQAGMVDGYYMDAEQILPDTTSFWLIYLGMRFNSSDAANQGFQYLTNSLINATNQTSTCFTGGAPSTTACQVAGASQCLQTVLPALVNSSGGFPYTLVVRTVLRGNSVAQVGYMLETNDDYSSLSPTANSYLDGLSGAFIATPAAPPAPNPNPSPNPAPPPAPQPQPSPQPTPNPTPSPTPTPQSSVHITSVGLLHSVKGNLKPTTSLKSKEAGAFILLYSAQNAAGAAPSATITISQNGHTVGTGDMKSYAASDGTPYFGFITKFTIKKGSAHLVATFNITLGSAHDSASMRFTVKAAKKKKK